MQATLSALLDDARQKTQAVPCFNVFGPEDAMAVIQATESLNGSVILACNPDVVDFFGIDTLLSMLKPLAEKSSAPVCVHLDHCYDVQQAIAAAKAGFDSVMYDGSQLSLAENIANTATVVKAAHAIGVDVEGEIGSVPYSEGRDWIKSELTEPSQAARFAADSGVDAVAVSVGNVHRLVSETRAIDHQRLQAIKETVAQPLVIHGATGIEPLAIRRMIEQGVCKFNIGTALRKAFGQSLRQSLSQNPQLFDRITLMKSAMPSVSQVAKQYGLLLSSVQQEALDYEN